MQMEIEVVSNLLLLSSMLYERLSEDDTIS
jgi:hypothetical protein